MYGIASWLLFIHTVIKKWSETCRSLKCWSFWGPAKLKVLHRQILFSLIQKHTKHRVAPRYLKLVAISNFLPFNADKKYLHCLCLALFCADFHPICCCSVYASVGEVLKFTSNRRLLMDLSTVEMDVWGYGVFSAWSSPETNWAEWVRVGNPDGNLLLSWRTFLADCSRGLHCWGSHTVSERLELVLHLCWSFWGPATDLHARLCQTPSWSLWSCGTDRAGVVSVLYDDSTFEELFYCALAWSKTCLSFCQEFLDLGLESVENNSEHDLAGIID